MFVDVRLIIFCELNNQGSSRKLLFLYQYPSKGWQYRIASCTQCWRRKDAKQLCMYVHKHWMNGTGMYLHEYLRSPPSCLLKVNVGRFSFPHTPVWVDKTAYSQPISCVCAIHVCQVAFKLYHSFHDMCDWLIWKRVTNYYKFVIVSLQRVLLCQII